MVSHNSEKKRSGFELVAELLQNIIEIMKHKVEPNGVLIIQFGGNMTRLNKKKIAVLGLAAVMSATMFTGCKVSSDTPILGKILGLHSDEIFEVDRLVCSDNEYKLVFMNYVNKYKKDFGGKIDWEAQIDKETTLKDFIMKKVKDDMAVKYAISAMAETERVKLDKEDMKSINDMVEEYYGSLSGEEKEYFDSDMDVVISVYTNYYMADKVYNKATETVGDDISEEDARVAKIQYIRMSSDNTSQSQIISKLTSIAKDVNAGKRDFAREAKQLSEDDSVERIVKKNQAKTKLELEAFNVKKEKTSKVIQDGNNYYLIYCVDNYMKDETTANKTEMIEQAKKAAFKKKYDSFLKDTDYDFNTSEWEDIVPEDVDNTKTSNLLEVYTNR